MSDEQIARVASWREASVFGAEERMTLELAEGMTATPAEVSDDLFQRAQEHLSADQLVELAAEIAFENFRARFNRMFGVEAPGIRDRT